MNGYGSFSDLPEKASFGTRACVREVVFPRDSMTLKPLRPQVWTRIYEHRPMFGTGDKNAGKVPRGWWILVEVRIS